MEPLKKLKNNFMDKPLPEQCTCGCSHSPKVQVVMDLGLDWLQWLAGFHTQF